MQDPDLVADFIRAGVGSQKVGAVG
jgi:hypothetical protein